MIFKKIVVIQTAFLGDVLLTLPMIYHLKKKFPNAKIDVVVRPESSEIKFLLPSIDEVILLDKSREKIKNTMQLIKKLKKSEYDLLISPHRSFRTSMISYLSKIPITVGFDIASASFLYSKRVKYSSSKHEIERNLDLIKDFLGDYNLPLHSVVVAGWKEKIPLNLVPYIKNEKFNSWIKDEEKIIAIAPGTVWNTKKYPEEYFAILIRDLLKQNIEIILLGSNKDRITTQKILSLTEGSNSKSIIDFSGELNVSESISVIDKCKVLVCNDSAPTHMGLFTNCKVLTIYGSTIPEFGFYPYRDEDAIIQIEKLYCKPCGIHGRRFCPEIHFRCMYDLKPEYVLKKILEMI